MANSGRDTFRPFKARVIEASKLFIGPSPTVASFLTLPVDAEVMALAARSECKMNWYKVSYMRREGWVVSTQIEEIKKPMIVKDRRKLNFTGLSDREKDKIRLFEQYDKESAVRAIEEVLGEKSKFITRPIRRTGISKFQIEDLKEEAYCRIEKLRQSGRKR